MYEVRNRKGEIIGYKLSQRVNHVNGKGKVLTTYSNKSVRDCKKKLKAMVDEFEENKTREKGYVFTANDTVKNYANNWYEVYVAHSDLTDETKRDKKYYMGKLIKEFGDRPIGSITNDECQHFINQYEGYSKQHVKHMRNLAREIFQKAQRQDIIEFNPMEDVVFPQTAKTQKRALTPEERIMILESAKGHRYEPIVMLLYYTGIRPKELRYLEWEGIDFDNQIITVGESKTKNGEGRKLPMSNELKLVLQKYRLKHPTGKYVFPSAQCINEPMKSYALSNKWNEFKTEMDIANGAKAVDGKVVESTIAPDLTMYIFRHTFASDCQAAGVPINVAKEFMGHADISTTAKTYTHMIDEVFNENRKKLAAKSAERIKEIKDKHSLGGKIIKMEK